MTEIIVNGRRVNVSDNFTSLSPEEQQRTVEEIASRLPAEEAPRERFRTALQGLTFGTADEAEAALIAMATDRTYEDVLAEIRGNLEAYSQARPLEAALYEMGGAALPAIAAAPFTGGASVAPTLARLGAIGAAEGAAYGFGTGEGGFMERLSRVPGGAAFGAAGGAAGGVAARGISSGVNLLTDAARRIAGRRGSSIVENEIERIVGESGMTPDQAAQAIIDGRILVENETIRRAARGIHSQGGQPARAIRGALEGRPEEMRGEALAELRRYLSDVDEPSALQAQRRSDEAARAAERRAYSQFEDVPAPPQVVGAVGEALRRVPAASTEVDEAMLAASGQGPLMSAPQIGPPSFTRTPTVSEAERIRRAIGNRASSLFQGSMGAAGEAVEGVQRELRSVLDMSIPELATVRGQAAAIRANRDAFEAGTNALSGDANQRIIEFGKLASPEAVQSYRAGMMAAIENRAQRGSRQSMFRNMLNEETAENKILRAVFPEEQIDTVLNVIDRAVQSEAARGTIIGGSPTAETFTQMARKGTNISGPMMLQALNNDPMAIAAIARNLVTRSARPLTESEMSRVVDVLVSQDPDLVRRALIDESGMAAFQRGLSQILNTVTESSAGAAGTGAAMIGAPASEGYLRGLLQMQ